MARTAGLAVLQEIRNSPPEWHRTIGGLGKRFASAMGKHLIKSSVQFGVAAVRHEELRYHPSETPGFGHRLEHALLSAVITRNKISKQHTMATGRISGSLAAGLISRVWHPARFRTVASGFSSAGISLASDAAVNVVREFWPEIRHRRRR